jgi:chromosome segregation ATPase
MDARENGEIVEALLLENERLKKDLDRVSGTYSFNLQEQAVENRIAVEAAKAAKASENQALLEAKLLKMENDAFKAQIASLRSELKVTLGAHDFAVLKINEIQAERDSARAQLSDVTHNNDILQAEFDAELEVKQDLAAMYKDVSQNYGKLQEDNEALEAKFESLQANFDAKLEVNQDIAAMYKHVSNHYGILQEENEALEAKFESLQAELMAYKVVLNDVLSDRN